MPRRRYLSLWFPRLGAERALRARRGAPPGPFAVAAEAGGALILASLSVEAEAAGLSPGQKLAAARAVCPALVTEPADPPGEAAFLDSLARWAWRFSPLVGQAPPDGLMLDITGCAHLWGGEAAMAGAVAEGAAALGLTARAGLADTPGAAAALARQAGRAGAGAPAGNLIDREARATRSRAARRPAVAAPAGAGVAIAPPGRTRAALAPLPVAALELEDDAASALAALGLGRIGDLAGMPRAALARRVGQGVVERLDAALGVRPAPISARAPAPALSLPEPVGQEDDIAAALETRLLPALARRLAEAGRGARRLRLEATRSDHTLHRLEAGLARASADPARLGAVLWPRLGSIDPGFGIERLRLVATLSEPAAPRQHEGHAEAGARAAARAAGSAALDDLIGRIGARIGLEAITRLHPAESHIPEKAALTLAAAWSEPAAGPWPAPTAPRPLELFRPEPVRAPAVAGVPPRFRWRGQSHATRAATGPERIAPEWWLDEPDWRSGVRDYWRVETARGARLWLFYAHGAAMPAGWFCQGVFG